MLRGAGLRLRLHRGDLTAATAGAIVTSANDSLVGNRQPTYWRFISRVNADGLLRKKAGFSVGQAQRLVGRMRKATQPPLPPPPPPPLAFFPPPPPLAPLITGSSSSGGSGSPETADGGSPDAAEVAADAAAATPAAAADANARRGSHGWTSPTPAAATTTRSLCSITVA